MRALDLARHVENFRRRTLQDALSEATAAYWLRRARQWEDAVPRAGDFNGRASAADLTERARRCRAIADACRHHAELLSVRPNSSVTVRPEPIETMVREVLAEVA